MKNLIIFFLLIYSRDAVSQTPKKISFYAGVKLRVTPIYTGQSPENIIISVPGIINAQQQPDLHLSGLGLHTSAVYDINKKWQIALQQTTRYDILYNEWLLERNTSSKIRDKKRIIFDLYAVFSRKIVAKKNTFVASVGLGLCGINTGYTQIIRKYSSQTNYVDYKEKINFLFPAATAGFGWQKGKFLSQFKMGYCWNNPTWFVFPFLFPELSLQYKIK